MTTNVSINIKIERIAALWCLSKFISRCDPRHTIFVYKTKSPQCRQQVRPVGVVGYHVSLTPIRSPDRARHWSCSFFDLLFLGPIAAWALIFVISILLLPLKMHVDPTPRFSIYWSSTLGWCIHGLNNNNQRIGSNALKSHEALKCDCLKVKQACWKKRWTIIQISRSHVADP